MKQSQSRSRLKGRLFYSGAFVGSTAIPNRPGWLAMYTGTEGVPHLFCHLVGGSALLCPSFVLNRFNRVRSVWLALSIGKTQVSV